MTIVLKEGESFSISGLGDPEDDGYSYKATLTLGTASSTDFTIPPLVGSGTGEFQGEIFAVDDASDEDDETFSLTVRVKTFWTNDDGSPGSKVTVVTEDVVIIDDDLTCNADFNGDGSKDKYEGEREGLVAKRAAVVSRLEDVNFQIDTNIEAENSWVTTANVRTKAYVLNQVSSICTLITFFGPSPSKYVRLALNITKTLVDSYRLYTTVSNSNGSFLDKAIAGGLFITSLLGRWIDDLRDLTGASAAIKLLNEHRQYKIDYQAAHEEALKFDLKQKALEFQAEQLLNALTDIDSCLADANSNFADHLAAASNHDQAEVAHSLQTVGAIQFGGSGDNRLEGSATEDVLSGEDGNDVVNGRQGNDIIFGGSDNDKLNGGAGNDMMIGGNGADTLNGSNGDDFLSGDPGGDIVSGGDGRDSVVGGKGLDSLSGGAGADIFIFYDIKELGKGRKTDFVEDFSIADGDRLDVSAIDADSTVAKNQDFVLLDSTATAFSAPGQIMIRSRGGNTFVDFNTDADTTTAEATLKLQGILQLSAVEFVL